MADHDASPARIARLTARAEAVLGDHDLAREWLRTPNRGLAGATPAAHARTETGAREVEDLLGRLAHGVVV